MRRRLRLGFLFAAAVLQIAAPLAAYARVAQLPDAIAHCAESLCCIGSATGAAAPPGVPARTHLGEFASVAAPAATPSAAPASIVAAALVVWLTGSVVWAIAAVLALTGIAVLVWYRPVRSNGS